jgi:hypothetical protein
VSALRTPAGVLEEIPPFRSRSLSEATLFRGLGALQEPVTEPCACGLPITALSDSDVDIQLAVAAHNRMPEHQLYRLRTGDA